MDKKIAEEITEEVADRKGFIAWVKEHKTQLLFPSYDQNHPDKYSIALVK